MPLLLRFAVVYMLLKQVMTVNTSYCGLCHCFHDCRKYFCTLVTAAVFIVRHVLLEATILCQMCIYIAVSDYSSWL